MWGVPLDSYNSRCFLEIEREREAVRKEKCQPLASSSCRFSVRAISTVGQTWNVGSDHTGMVASTAHFLADWALYRVSDKPFGLMSLAHLIRFATRFYVLSNFLLCRNLLRSPHKIIYFSYLIFNFVNLRCGYENILTRYMLIFYLFFTFILFLSHF